MSYPQPQGSGYPTSYVPPSGYGDHVQAPFANATDPTPAYGQFNQAAQPAQGYSSSDYAAQNYTSSTYGSAYPGSSYPDAAYAGAPGGRDGLVGVPLDGAKQVAYGEPLPTAADQPIVEAGYKDVWAAVLFWIHVLVIVILAFALGVKAMKDDGARGDAPQGRDNLDFNSSLFVRMLILSLFVGAVVSSVFFVALSRFGAQIIKCALYTSAAVQLILACAAFAFSVGAALVLLIMAAFTICYIYFVRNRIPFAAAHLEIACDVIRQYPSLLVMAVSMLVVQGLWIFFWGAASLGVQHKINQDEEETDPDHESSGGVIMFFMSISFFWGVLVFRGVIHFVTASVVGNWWFLGTPTAVVSGSLKRAFTTSFGSICFGSLITAVLHAIERAAHNARRKAEQSNRPGAAFTAACALCLIRMVRRAVEYFNQWAIIYVALTGASYTRAGKEAFNLFAKRGWAAVINDDLTATAMAIVCMMTGALSAVIGGGTAYALMGRTDGTVAGIVAFFSFLAGIAMALIITGVATSAVRTVFVCFALNPAALGATHPAHLNKLVEAWHKAHPAALQQSGYTAAYYTGPVQHV